MYVILIAVLLGVGAWSIVRGVARESRRLVATGIAIVTATVLFFLIMDVWAEALWFHEQGYGSRFWLFLAVRIALPVAGAIIGAAGVFLLNIPLRRSLPMFSRWPEAIGGVLGAIQTHGAWQVVLLFFNRVSTGVRDPALDLDVGLYLFTVPFLELLHGLLIWIVVVALGSAALAAIRSANAGDATQPGITDSGQRRHFLIGTFALAVALSLGLLIDVFHLLYSQWGVVTGPGWTDMHVRLPGYFALAALVPLVIGLLFSGSLRRWIAGIARPLANIRSETLRSAAAAWLAVAAAWLVIAAILPQAAQWLFVEPNEITLERPYIANNIEFTRRGFNLGHIQERQFPANEELTRGTINRNDQLVSEIRLWDWRALDAVYKQFQEIRLYYEFADVDIDRYRVGGRYRQVMVSARELDQRNLPAGSQTFVNRRFKYTHGYGLTLATVSDFTPSGLPNLLIKDIPPVAEYPDLEVKRPEIYYGELTRNPVVANTDEPEFDYPTGDENAYVHYQGDGGVPLRNLWRKFLFGWKFGGTAFLFSRYPGPDSRVMMYRQVRERVQHLAPFLAIEDDPYVVLADGRIYWIIDAYTRSDRYPYSTRYRARMFAEAGFNNADAATNAFEGDNYLRNSVKIVVDAYNGSVDYYVFDNDDPLIRAWQKTLPGFFRDAGDMPPALRGHVRYPQGLLLTQGLVYTKYHMQNPAVFYNQEDLWVRATEKHYGSVQAVEPYYVMWQPPGSDQAEFVMMLPFTPKDRQVLIGWIAGLSDGRNYGRFLAYKFPKERRVLGPQQVETKIDQDRYLSGQLTLWDQRGSNVLRGNVLAIPLDGTLLYVEPIYLHAETAAYPELRVVVVMHGDNMSYGESFDEALEGLFSGQANEPGDMSLSQLAADAAGAFSSYRSAMGDGRYDEAAAALAELQDLLERMQRVGIAEEE